MKKARFSEYWRLVIFLFVLFLFIMGSIALLVGAPLVFFRFEVKFKALLGLGMVLVLLYEFWFETLK